MAVSLVVGTSRKIRSSSSSSSLARFSGIRRRLVVSTVGSQQQQHATTTTRTMFSRSPTTPPFYDSHGDYQADDESGHFLPYAKHKNNDNLPLYEYQNSLPRFPIPSLTDTIERLVPSCLPLASDPQEEKAFRKACADFSRQARRLQILLEDKGQSEQNWLQSWWNRYGYLRFRDPSPINVNYLFQLPKTTSGFNQIEKGANVLHSALVYSRLVSSGSLPQETIGKDTKIPLCSSMYKYLFHACRIPRPNQDIYRIFYPNGDVDTTATTTTPKHAVVTAKGHYFTVDLVDPSDGRPYSRPELESALTECQRQAETLVSQTPTAEAVRNLGILTTGNRDEWAANRKRLRREIPGMKHAFQRLESGLLLLCLDEDETNNNNNSRGGSLSQNARSYLMGTQGRWYDKSLQFFVTQGGDLGLNGEHSMMDGMPVVGLCGYILQQEQQAATDKPSIGSLPRVEPIFASDTILEAIAEGLDSKEEPMTRAMMDKAFTDFNALRDSLDLEVQSFQGYGATWIKKHAKCSPDAYVQMAIQLAIGKLTTQCDGTCTHYVPLATYESTQVRSYRYGRTETTRSVSPQSAEWVEAMLKSHPETDSMALVESFQKATTAHVDYIRKASKGCGVDRHLFGLQMIQAEHKNEDTVDLFTDPLFVRSKQWKVSTSTLPVNPGFGPVVVPDGVGVAYDIQSNHVYFTCTSYKNLAPALSHCLEESLIEMREMILSAKGHDKNEGRSKL